jgi:hypothetical protein
MRSSRLFRSGATVTVALAALALASVFVIQDSGPNQAAHFALVRALASGTPYIDGNETIDSAYIDGHFYAAKAPGLAILSVPWYAALRGVGLQDGSLATEAGYRHRVWELTLFGAVLPMLALLLFVYFAVERVVPGYGLATSVLLGAGTLLLPFSSLYFDHVLAAALGFGAFLVLLCERESGGRLWRIAAAGVVAGLAIVVEFPLGIVALALAAYAAAGASPLRRAVTYTAGVVVGVLPLLAYNWWAFGSPARLSYTNALKAPVGPGAPFVGANDEGFYGVGLPDPRAALSLLVSEKGLLVVTPLAVAALLGLPLLWRAGRRAETLVCGAIPLLFLAYNAAYYLPFGGQSPGPRFLIPALPFLALPLAVLLRARPLVVAGLGLVSAAIMALATVTGPLTGVEYGIGTWLGRLGRLDVVETVLGRLGLEPGWLAAVPFVLLLSLALGLALRRASLLDRLASDGPLLAGALGVWLLFALVGPHLVPADSEHGTREGVLAVVVLGVAAATALTLTWTRGAIYLLPLVPALVLATPLLTSRPRWSLLVSVAVLGGATLAWRRLLHAPATAHAQSSGGAEPAAGGSVVDSPGETPVAGARQPAPRRLLDGRSNSI